MNTPLANLLRPSSLEEIVGQNHLVGKNGSIRKLIANNTVPNMILYGPSGTGKTTLANIIAKSTSKRLYKLNATTASTRDIKDIVSELQSLENQNGVLLYLDEIQYFSKKQQQFLLEFIEKGDITLIASTTENPYFYIYNAIISRCTIFEFKPVEKYDILRALKRGVAQFEKINNCKIEFEKGVLEYISSSSGGDVRKSFNLLEVVISIADFYNNKYTCTLETAQSISSSPVRYDKDGDEHYDLLSAFHKSVRGSDPDAAIFYLAKLIACRDIISPCRRLLCIASEDIGLANPQAAVITKSLVDSALQLGLPEAKLPLAQATIYLATSPKSNSAAMAIDQALEDINNGLGKNIPAHLRDGHYAGAQKLNHAINYIYPHNFKYHYIKQQYLPDDITYRVYYKYGDNKIETATKTYWDTIKKEVK